MGRYFNCFPPEVINVINYHYITIYGHIDKLPFTCDTPGSYFITKDWDFCGTTSAIYITANVILDLQGHTISNHNSFSTIYVKDVYDVLIMNGLLYSIYGSIDVVNSRVFTKNLNIVNHYRDGSRGLNGDTGSCGKINTEPSKKSKHMYSNKQIVKNIPKNVKQCKRNKYHY